MGMQTAAEVMSGYANESIDQTHRALQPDWNSLNRPTPGPQGRTPFQQVIMMVDPSRFASVDDLSQGVKSLTVGSTIFWEYRMEDGKIKLGDQKFDNVDSLKVALADKMGLTLLAFNLVYSVQMGEFNPNVNPNREIVIWRKQFTGAIEN